ncbi:MAG: LysR family transcriptional regulator [bacterium]|nr:LysR family transcriptional regulator [bacterium]
MNLDNLICFLLVAENLSFARAAETLHISQPAVTKQIRSLEHELGVALFIRSTRHVELTPAGMSFYKDAKEIVTKTQTAVSRLKNRNTNPASLRIGLSNPAALLYLTPILKKFHEAHPDIYPNIFVPGYKVAINLFLENILDLLFLYKEDLTKKKDILFLELQKDHLACLVPAIHPLASKESVSSDDLNPFSIIACNPLNAPQSMADFQQQFLTSHSTNQVFYCEDLETAHCMVAAGMGVSVLPYALCTKSSDFAAIPLAQTPPLSFGIFYHQKTSNTALKHFLHLI